MKKILEGLTEMKKRALEELDSDIKILSCQVRFEMDTELRKTILKEKLVLLYILDIIDLATFNEYSDIMKSLIKDGE